MTALALRLRASPLLLLLTPIAVGAQTVRVGGTTTFRYIEVGTWVHDSIPAPQVPGDGLLRRAPDGTLVQCLTGETVCRFIRSADPVSTTPVVQDLTVSAWGLGRGVRIYAQLRGRGVLAGADSVWPRESDRFDALAAYVELDRTRFRVRAGRQWTVSGLGYYNFDGGSALVRPGRGLTIQAYGGRSLVRGLNESITSDAVSALESLAPDEGAWLLGSQIAYRAAPGRSVSVQYQREFRTDSSALYSERFAADGLYRTGWGQVDASLKADLASREINESLVRLRWDTSRALTLSAWGRTYKPFFELWTIWGAFSPVGFKEAGVTGAWRLAWRSAKIAAQAAYRTYPDTWAGTTFGEYRTDGWRVGLSGALTVAPLWTLEGSYHADVGLGSAKSSTSARVQRQLGDGAYLGFNATAFQTAYEFRVPEGVVWGLGADAAAPLGSRSRAFASAAWYHHRTDNNGSVPDWSQLRLTVRLDWTIGPEPGMSAVQGRQP
jgi:hypothetical protein